MSSKINLQTCEYACKSSIFQDNQLIYMKIHNYIQKDLYLMRKKAFNHIRKDAIESFFHIM